MRIKAIIPYPLKVTYWKIVRIKPMVPTLLKVYLKELYAQARQTIDLSSPSSFYDSLRMLWLFRKVREYTGLSTPRLKNLYTLSKTIDKFLVPGDIVECGTWKGGQRP